MKPHLIITYPFPLGRTNGGARMTREIARHLGRSGVRVTIVSLSAEMAFSFPQRPVEQEFLGLEFDAELALDDVQVVRVKPHPLHWILDARQIKRAVRRQVESGPVSMVLSYYTEGSFLPAYLEPLGIPFGFIATWQSYKKAMSMPVQMLPGRYARRILERLVALPHRRAKILFATSDFTKNELIEELGVSPERIRHCPLGVDPSFFDVPRTKPDAIKNLLFFGRVVASKGVMDMIVALGRIKRAGGPEFRCSIRGQGYLDQAKALIREWDLQEQVHVNPPANDGELQEELARAHLAILPSHYEAFGLAFAEAQAAGLPVVAYAAGSVPEVVLDGRTGWLGPLGDVDALQANIELALSDTEATYAHGLAGREHVRDHFTWPLTAQRIIAGMRQESGDHFEQEPVLS